VTKPDEKQGRLLSGEFQGPVATGGGEAVDLRGSRGAVYKPSAPTYQIIQQRYPFLKDYVYDVASTIETVTRWFVGRGFVFEWLEAQLDAFPCGYLRLIADAGLGKTAIAAEVARRYGAIVHFVNASEGVIRPAQCLNHLSARLIAQYDLPHDHLPERAGQDANFLQALLQEAAEKHSDTPVLLVIDALDEADPVAAGRNWLLLPDRLPPGVYVLLTHRPGDYPIAADAQTPQPEPLIIAWDDPRQEADIAAHLRRQAERPEICRALEEATPPIAAEQFVDALQAAAEGNFKYLDYVLADIAAREPGFDPLDLQGLPHGLRGYYAHFWAQMQPSTDAPEVEWEAWETRHLLILEGMGVAGEPVTARWLADQAGLPERTVRRILRKWQRFLRCERRADGTRTWRIVHRSFANFLAEKVDLQAAHRRVAAWYLDAWGGWEAGLPLLDISSEQHGGYGLRHLVNHMGAAAQTEDMHRLLSLENSSGVSNLWYLVKESSEDVSSYLADVHTAWRDAEEDGPAQLGLQVRYALIESSIHALAANIPEDLIVPLVKQGVWSPERAFAYTRLLDEGKGESILLNLSTALKECKRYREALSLAQRVTYKSFRVAALAEVVPYLPYEQQSELLEDLLSVLERIDGTDRYWALSRSIPHILPVFMGQAHEHLVALANSYMDLIEETDPYYLDVEWGRLFLDALDDYLSNSPWAVGKREAEQLLKDLDRIEDDFDGAQLLTVLAPYLPLEQLGQVLESAQHIEGDSKRAKLLSSLAPHLPPKLVEEAIHAAGSIHDDVAWAHALTEIAQHLPDNQEKIKTLQRVFAAIRDRPWGWSSQDLYAMLSRLAVIFARIGLYAEAMEAAENMPRFEFHNWQFIDTLAEMMPLLPLSLQERILAEIKRLENGVDLSHALEQLAPHVGLDLLSFEFLDLARSIEHPRTRAGALAGLVPHLPVSRRRFVLNELIELAWATGFTDPLVELAQRLPDDQSRRLLAEALGIVRQIGDTDARFSILAALGTHLPSEWTQDLVDAAREIRGSRERAGAMVDLLPSLWPEQKQEVILEILRMTPASENADSQALILADLAPHLAPDQLDRAVKMALELPMSGLLAAGPQAEAVAALIPFLPVEERCALMAKMFSTYNHWPAAIGRFAPYLSAEQRMELLDVAQDMESEFQRAEMLACLAPHLSGSELLTALRLAEELPQCEMMPGQIMQLLHDDQVVSNVVVAPESPDQFVATGRCPRAHAMAGLVPHLPSELRAEWVPELEPMLEQLGVEVHVRALVNLASQLPQQQKHEALVTALSLIQGSEEHDDERAKALSFLAAQISTEDEPGLLEDALKTVLSLQFEAHVRTDLPGVLSKEDPIRPRALAALAAPWREWAQVNASQAHTFWSEVLHASAVRHRALLLGDLKALIPVITTLGGDETAVEVACAIQDVGRWWP
jgi:hypothetical protein